jgi:hypothetical protein
MKFYQSALLALLVVAPAVAFLAPIHSSSCPVTRRADFSLSSLAASGSKTTVDLSIPPDDAARLAYDEWRAEFGKGAFDAKRYKSFEQNYKDVSIANVISKKEAREQGLDSPDLLTLNEFGDYTAEEYEQQNQVNTPAPTTSTMSVLGQAMQAAESQMEASSALSDAFDALDEEEMVGRTLQYITFVHSCCCH